MDIKQNIEKANEEAARRLTIGDPVLVDIAPAGEVIPGLKDKMVIHAGPPIEWHRMCGAQQGAIMGMVIYEGWAKTPQEAKRLLDKGEIRVEPNHHHQTVGPMAGTISPSAPVWVVENRAFGGNRAFCDELLPNPFFGVPGFEGTPRFTSATLAQDPAEFRRKYRGLRQLYVATSGVGWPARQRSGSA